MSAWSAFATAGQLSEAGQTPSWSTSPAPPQLVQVPATHASPPAHWALVEQAEHPPAAQNGAAPPQGPQLTPQAVGVLQAVQPVGPQCDGSEPASVSVVAPLAEA